MPSTDALPASGGFRHDAVFYAGEADLLRSTVPFIAEGVAADEPVLVVLSRPKIDALRQRLGGSAERVRFADMDEVGRNPARIIPVWQSFVEEHAGEGRPLRGIGEPVSASRTEAELVECQRHESLLNVAFNGVWPFRLLCPYDVATLDDAVVKEARRSHPHLEQDGVREHSPDHDPAEMAGDHLGDTLPAPPTGAVELAFDDADLTRVRQVVTTALRPALAGDRLDDLLLAVNELTTNSIRHGGGGGVIRVWTEGGAAVVEVCDGGRLLDPLAGRREPDLTSQGGRGLWLVNHLCDLVQIRHRDDGLTVRVRAAV